LKTARHLDRAIGITGIHDVGRIGPRAKGLLALAERKRTPLAVAVADAVGFRRDRPSVLEEALGGLVSETVKEETRHHAQLQRFRIARRQFARELAAGARPRARLADRQHIASRNLTA